jgi:hypothetical protein
MSHHTATLQSTSATAFDFAYTVAERLYWLDDNYTTMFSRCSTHGLRLGSVTWLSVASTGHSSP